MTSHTAYTLRNLDDVEDTAPRFGLEDHGEVRSAREDLHARGIGVTHYRWRPGRRVGFGRTTTRRTRRSTSSSAAADA